MKKNKFKKKILLKYKKENLITLFKWRNDKVTRNYSLNANKVTFSKHKQWINKKIKNKENKIYIYYFLKKPIGMCSIIKKKESFYLGYSIDKNFRGKSHSKKMLRLFLKKIKNKFYKNKIFAIVLLKNKKSIRILTDINFMQVSGNKKYIKMKLNF